MHSFGKNEHPGGALRSTPAGATSKTLFLLLLACALLAITGCGGGSSNPAQSSLPFTGNWQFNLTPPAGTPPPFTGDPNGASALSVLQGGFFVQNNGSLSGQAAFSIWVTSLGSSVTECNSGTATITGTVSGQTVNLNASVSALVQDPTTGNYVPGTQIFTLSNGQLSPDNSTVQGGTYSSTAGFYVPQGSTTVTSCGSAQSGVSWTATSVPQITGAFQGFFHSTSQSNTFLAGQVFPVSGALTQGQNTGASSATVTGTLAFAGYPCLTKAALTGQISGSSVVLQIFDPSSGSDVGQLGGLGNGSNGIYSVTFNSTPNGYVLQNLGNAALAYALNTSGCPGSGLSSSTSGDVGNICLAFGAPNPVTGTTPCSEPITVSPASVTFAPQLLASGSRTRQLITVTNIQPAGSAPLNLSLNLSETDSGLIYQNGGSDFNGFPNFTEQDTCGGSLAPQQSCTVSISFSPQQSCPWIPAGSVPNGLAPAKCPGLFNPLVPPKALLSALLKITIPGSSTPDGNSSFYVPIKGTGLSAVVPTPAELDFGAEDFGESSPPQTLTLTNQSAYPVQILNPASGFGQSCNSDMTFPYILSRPPSGVSGLVVAATNGANNFITPNPNPPSGPPTVQYYCDLDQTTNQASFQISSDTCSGQTLSPSGSPNDSCTLQITFAPQPDSYANFPDPNTTGGLDYFLQLNTLPCDLNDNPPQPPPGPSNPCEIDSGRFPVELTANPPGPLRMSPAAGLDFGTWLRGATSTPLTITLTNDEADNLTVNFTGKALTGADYLETDNNNCPPTLSPGASCQLTFTFTPSVSGFDSGNLVIGYNTSGSSGNQYHLHQYIYLRGIGQ